MIENIMFWKIFGKLPLQRNKVVFIQFNGKGYADNPKYIAEEFIRRKSTTKLIWLVDDKKYDFPREITPVLMGSLESIYHLSTAKVWVSNYRFQDKVLKREGQIYVQTWHGGLGIKKIEKGAFDKLTKEYVAMAEYDSQITDVFLSNCTFLSRLFLKDFWYQGPILQVGAPKNDIFFHDNSCIKERLIKKYSLPRDCKFLLYAPTFRKNGLRLLRQFPAQECLKALERKDGKSWICLIRAHPHLTYTFGNRVRLNEFTYNISSHADAQEVLVLADVLITDYSSIMFDFVLQGKSCFVYAPDKEEYMDERGIYYSLEELPFPLSLNKEQLIKNLENGVEEDYSEKVKEFMDRQGVVDDGNASRKVVNYILKELQKKQKREKRL